jgi:hypothetical protein
MTRRPSCPAPWQTEAYVEANYVEPDRDDRPPLATPSPETTALLDRVYAADEARRWALDLISERRCAG